MTPFARTLPIALAAGLLLAAHGAQAASTQADAHVDVVGQLSLGDACPAVDVRELADQLAPSWDDAVKPAVVEVDFKLRRQHVYDVRPATASQRTVHQIRRAVHGLSCDGGDDQVHAVRLVVRYVDADARAASLRQAGAAR